MANSVKLNFCLGSLGKGYFKLRVTIKEESPQPPLQGGANSKEAVPLSGFNPLVFLDDVDVNAEGQDVG